MFVLARCVTIPDKHTSLAYLESDAAFLLTAFGTAAVCCHRAFTSLLIIINPTPLVWPRFLAAPLLDEDDEGVAASAGRMGRRPRESVVVVVTADAASAA